jgi:hypothetical protein
MGSRPNGREFKDMLLDCLQVEAITIRDIQLFGKGFY